MQAGVARTAGFVQDKPDHDEESARQTGLLRRIRSSQ
jgi:hypothetical protein